MSDLIVEERWEYRRRAVLEALARPFPQSQYEAREGLIRRLLTEGLHEGNVREIGQQLEPLSITIPRPPREKPAAPPPEAPPLPRLSAEMERAAALALGEGRVLQSPGTSLPEMVEVYRFDRTRKLRDAQPVSGTAYSALDRSLIVVDGTPGGTFSISAMNQSQWDAFRSAAVHRGYTVTNPRGDGTLRTDARTLEYHIIADAIDAPTLRYFRENNPYVRVIRYDDVADIAAGRGEVLIDTPRQYLRGELAREGTVHDVGDFVEVRNGDTVVRRFPASQVSAEFYHYEGRLTPERAAEVADIAASRGWDLARIGREQGAELLSVLQSPPHRWTLEEVHAFIGSEGMMSYYNRGGAGLPFGFSSVPEFRQFSGDLLAALEAEGLPIRSGQARVFMSGSALTGFSSKGGQFRWSDAIDATGAARAASDYDVKVVVTPEVFAQWVERSIAAQPTERLRKMLRHYIGNTDGLRWAEVPPEFREALRPLLERYPRVQQVTIALEGGYWHVQDPMADAPNIELTLPVESPRIAEAPLGVAAPAVSPWREVMTDPVDSRGIASALREMDPALADFFEREISNAASPVTTMSELLSRVNAWDPAILDQAAAAAVAEGRPITAMRERGIFELITRAAASRGHWSLSDPTRLTEMSGQFESRLRPSPGSLERPEGVEAREREERERREAERRLDRPR